MNDGKVRTKMADALMNAAITVASKGSKMSRATRHLTRKVLTNDALGIGVKYDPKRAKKKKQVPAESAAMMKEAA
jgi:hypothetical protein